MGSSFLFLLPTERSMSKQKSDQKLYHLVLSYKSGHVKPVTVRASSEEVAIRRALKRNPEAVSAECVTM